MYHLEGPNPQDINTNRRKANPTHTLIPDHTTSSLWSKLGDRTAKLRKDLAESIAYANARARERAKQRAECVCQPGLINIGGTCYMVRRTGRGSSMWMPVGVCTPCMGGKKSQQK
ncbi:hypothetical protein BJ508DRAFT_364504 [Ascobolus immersus RN42]|uniref:Uncharacterized protein n=1 Tax=Ascobolus immersus RN42 TaxID=1160509 RepID=A0A3N4HU76_ASCIM|nr:hypothetical protein BJ508DRAFT_364504 [Ascobolus immersus RN42]